MDKNQRKQIRRKSMQGTLLLALCLIAAIAFALTLSLWLAGMAVVFLLVGVVMLYQVGKSLP